MSRFITSLAIPALAVAAMMFSSSACNAQDLAVGDKAPALDIEHWFSKGNGKFEEISEFEEGKVYVVEFWATWCGPCIASMPHLAETQEKYAESGVQLISVSDEDEDTVKEFLDKKVRGDADGMKYAELTSAYCLTTDPDESVYQDYMEAADQNGIPTAFIVGKTGNIEYIGHPMEMDEPLEQIVNDTWDPAAWKIKQEQAAAAMGEAQELFQELGPMMQEGEFEEGLEMLDEKLAETDNEALKEILGGIRVQILMEIGGPEAVTAFNEVVETNKDNPDMLNQISWGIVEKFDAGDDVSEEMINAAAAAAQIAVEGAPESDAILDTLAHLQFMQGNIDGAIETQEKAVEFATEQFRVDINDYLDFLKAEKEKNDG